MKEEWDEYRCRALKEMEEVYDEYTESQIHMTPKFSTAIKELVGLVALEFYTAAYELAKDEDKKKDILLLKLSSKSKSKFFEDIVRQIFSDASQNMLLALDECGIELLEPDIADEYNRICMEFWLSIGSLGLGFDFSLLLLDDHEKPIESYDPYRHFFLRQLRVGNSNSPGFDSIDKYTSDITRCCEVVREHLVSRSTQVQPLLSTSHR